jgi:hypothetical protein
MNYAGMTSKDDLITLKNSTLNVLLGNEPGQPKYSVNQMKSITKAMLIGELNARIIEMEAAAAAEPTADKKKRGPKSGVSKNKACAASKQTNLIKAYRAGKLTHEALWTKWNEDVVLQEYCSSEKFAALISGEWVSRTRGQIVTLTVEIDD